MGGEAAGNKNDGEDDGEGKRSYPLEARRQAGRVGPLGREDAVVEVLGEERSEHDCFGDDEQDDAQVLVGPAGLVDLGVVRGSVRGRAAAQGASARAHGVRIPPK